MTDDPRPERRDDLLTFWRTAGVAAEQETVKGSEPSSAGEVEGASASLAPASRAPGSAAPEAPARVVDDGVAPEAGPGRMRRALSHLDRVRAAAGLVIVVLLVVAGWFAWRDHDSSATLSDRTAAASAARTDAVALATYDYAHLDQFFTRVKRFSTPGFATQFTKGAQSLNKILVQYKAHSTGKLQSYGVKGSHGDRITVLVVVSQTVANSASNGSPSNQTEAFEYGMVPSGGRWLLDAATSVTR